MSSRKTFICSPLQHKVIRNQKEQYMVAQGIKTMSDINYILTCSNLVNRSLKHKGAK